MEEVAVRVASVARYQDASLLEINGAPRRDRA